MGHPVSSEVKREWCTKEETVAQGEMRAPLLWQSKQWHPPQTLKRHGKYAHLAACSGQMLVHCALMRP